MCMHFTSKRPFYGPAQLFPCIYVNELVSFCCREVILHLDYKQIYQSRHGVVVLCKGQLWWIKLLNTDEDSWAHPLRASFWVHPHTTASNTESRGSMEQHWCWQTLKCWAGKVLGFLKPQYSLCKNNRRLGALSKRLLQSLRGCSYNSESCLEKLSYITYDVLAQMLEVIPSILLRLPNRGVLLTWEDARQSLL